MLLALEDGRSIFPGDDSVLSQIWFSHDAVGHIAVFDWITKPQKLSSVMSLACSAPPERTAPMRAALVFRHPRPPIRSTPWRRRPAHCSIRIWSALSRAFRIMRMAIVAYPFRRSRVKVFWSVLEYPWFLEGYSMRVINNARWFSFIKIRCQPFHCPNRVRLNHQSASY